MTETVHHGSCLCGQVKYEVRGQLRPVAYCHCVQCRKQFGHYCAATNASADAVAITGDVAWYASSDTARRGFCPTCGSGLFWKREGGTTVSIMAGSLDGPTGLQPSRHIFCADKGDYYEITDGLPQSPKWD